MHILDSDTCVRLLKNQSAFVRKLALLPSDKVFMSAVTYHELYYGALHSSDPARHFKLLATLSNAITVLSFTQTSAASASQIRQDLAAKGSPIGPLDTLIAGHALEHELILVTGNTREFSRVNGLTLENWVE